MSDESAGTRASVLVEAQGVSTNLGELDLWRKDIEVSEGPSLSLDVANLTLATERGEGNVGDLHPEGVFSEGSHWRRGAVWG